MQPNPMYNAVIILGLLASMFFIVSWSSGQKDRPVFQLPFKLLWAVLPWRTENIWLWPKLYFISAEICFWIGAGAGFVGLITGADVIAGEVVFLGLGLFFRNGVRLGLLEDGYGDEFVDQVFKP